MENEKITIKDSKRKQQMIIDTQHPFYNKVFTSLMPDEFREEMRKKSNLEDNEIEEIIGYYYESIEEKTVFSELIPLAIMND